jgi:heterogeneous nuclear ribonucleoprotein U-like protein 1
VEVNGLSRKRNYHGRWEVLIKKCTECFNTILDMAAKRRRNYILDQVLVTIRH